MKLCPVELMAGWMLLAAIVLQCIVVGLLPARYPMPKGFRINAQNAWMLAALVVVVGGSLVAARMEHITPQQIVLILIVKGMLALNCISIGII